MFNWYPFQADSDDLGLDLSDEEAPIKIDTPKIDAPADAPIQIEAPIKIDAPCRPAMEGEAFLAKLPNFLSLDSRLISNNKIIK